jgi:hypothetical protein
MATQNKKNITAPKNKINVPEKESVVGQEEVYQNQEVVEKSFEKIENKQFEERISAELRREIDIMEANPALKKDAEIEKGKIGFLDQEKKLEYLLKLAKDKGLVFAIQIARKMGDPFILDLLHDTLAKEGYFKDFLPKAQQSTSQANNDDN